MALTHAELEQIRSQRHMLYKIEAVLMSNLIAVKAHYGPEDTPIFQLEQMVQFVQQMRYALDQLLEDEENGYH